MGWCTCSQAGPENPSLQIHSQLGAPVQRPLAVVEPSALTLCVQLAGQWATMSQASPSHPLTHEQTDE